MPLSTFQNLHIDQQEKIRQNCYKEFALHNYKNASVSNIVKNLNLAKGSFYRYFKSKLDLYSYLLEYSTKLRMHEIDNLVEQEQEDFFRILIKNFENKIDFDIKHPLKSIFTYRVLQEKDTPEIQALVTNLKRNVFKYIESLLLKFVNTGLLKKDLDIQLTAFSVFQMQAGIYDYLMYYKNVNFIRNIEEGESVFTISKNEIMGIVIGMVNILKSGIKA